MPIRLTDTARTIGSVLRAVDATTLGFSDGSKAVLVNLGGTETLGASLTESVLMRLKASAADALAVRASESVVILLRSATSDAVRVIILEGTPNIQDLLGGLITKSGTDALRIGLTEQPVIVISFRVSEVMRAGLADATTLNLVIRAQDAIALHLAEATLQRLGLLASDAFAIRISETTRLLVKALTAETLRALILEASDITDLLGGLITKSASDNALIGLVERLKTAGTLMAAEALALGLSEAATASVGVGPNVMVATVMVLTRHEVDVLTCHEVDVLTRHEVVVT